MWRRSRIRKAKQCQTRESLFAMSSFKRRIQGQQTVPIKGTQSVIGAPSLLQVSTGVPSIDDLLGGGLPLGHVLLILSPDYNSAWGELVSHYFVAQGLSSHHQVLVCDPRPERFVSGCMWYPGTAKPHIENAGHDDAQSGGEAPGDTVKIAWRYEQMKQFKTTVDELNPRSGECRQICLETQPEMPGVR
jgi:elongator complex protein 4